MREQIAKRKRKPPQPTPRWQYKRRPSTRPAVDSLRPLQLDGERRVLTAQKLMVFVEGPVVVLSISSARGTVSFPMSRKDAASLSGLLARRLAEVV